MDAVRLDERNHRALPRSLASGDEPLIVARRVERASQRHEVGGGPPGVQARCDSKYSNAAHSVPRSDQTLLGYVDVGNTPGAGVPPASLNCR